MTKKLLYVVLGGIFIFGVLFLLWSWLFSGSGNTNQSNGSFGTSTDSTQNVVGNNSGSLNGQTNLGQDASNGTITLGQNGQNSSSGGLTGSNANANTGSGSTTVFTTVSASNSGAQWLSGAGGAGVSSGNGYKPTSINGLGGASVGGTVPTIGGTAGGGSNGGLGLDGALLGAGIAGTVSCAIRSGALATALGAGTTAGAGVVATGVPVGGPGLALLVGNSSAQTTLQTGDQTTSFAGCILNVLAKAALQQITASVVNWINSGFNGSPSFVSNYQQFFTNVADLAAGQFIQGSGLSFLCSPFKQQIKIAIAQSYANRNAQSCTLSKVINNVNSFMNGNFSQGGWGGLLSVTTQPTNNPYGAYSYGQIGLSNAQSSALSNAKSNISPTGFLNMTQQSCSGNTSYGSSVTSGQNSQAAQVSCPPGCTCKVTTPGTIIEGTLQKSLGSSIDQLGLASSLDQIISALTTQLITKALQGGLSNLSGTTGIQNTYQTPDQAAAQTKAQTILSNLQGQAVYAQQYGSILQGSIADIQNTQRTVSSLISCWGTAASSSALTADKQTQAASYAASAQSTYNTLEGQVGALNSSIASVNSELATITQLQGEALSIASSADVQTLINDYNTAQSTQPFIAAADVTTAQQNRTTLQSQMSSINASVQAGLTQCQAFGQ